MNISSTNNVNCSPLSAELQTAKPVPSPATSSIAMFNMDAGATDNDNIGENRPKMFNLLEQQRKEYEEAVPPSDHLSSLSIGADQTPVIFFTSTVSTADTHFIDTPELKSYILCNGGGCAACQAGKKASIRYFVPVFSVLAGSILIITMTDNRKPTALLPQTITHMNSPKPELLLISKQGYQYKVENRPLTPQTFIDQKKIEVFNSRLESGDIDLTSVFKTISNDELAAIPEISTMLMVNGHTNA